MQVDLLIHEVARIQEALQRADRRLIEGETARPDEAVATEPLHIHSANLHAGHVRVAADVVEVIYGEDAREQWLHDAQPLWCCFIFKRRLGDEEAHPGRVNGFTLIESIAFGVFAGRAAESADDLANLMLDDQRREIFVRESLPRRAARVIGGWELLQHLVVKEVGERSVAHIVQESGNAQCLYNEPLTWDRIATCAQLLSERTVEVACPEACLMHHAETVCKAAVFGGGEDPTCALQLTDATESLQPRCIQQILFGCLLREVAERCGTLWCESLGQLDVAVDRIADQVDRLEACRLTRTAAAHAMLLMRRCSVPPRRAVSGQHHRGVPAASTLQPPRPTQEPTSAPQGARRHAHARGVSRPLHVRSSVMDASASQMRVTPPLV